MNYICVFAVSLAASLPMSVSAQTPTLSLLTQDAPPRNYMKDGHIVGAASDQVFELMKRAGVEYKVELMHWKRAIVLAETEPNTCVFNTVHSEDRGSKFKWVEPLILEPIVLVKKKGSPINPVDLNAAKGFKIAALARSSSYETLQKYGFLNIQTTTSHELTLQLLEKNQVDLGVALHSSVQEFIQQGLNVEEVMTLDALSSGLACSKETPDAVIAKLNETLDGMIKDGTQKKILSVYGF